MSFNFDSLLTQGKEAAENVLRNQSEINAVFSNLEKSLSNFLSIDIYFEERPEYKHIGKPSFFEPLSELSTPREKTEFNLVYIKRTNSHLEKAIFKIKHSDLGYPVTLVKGKQHYVCSNKSELEESLGDIVANPQLHLTLKSFISNAKEEDNKKAS